MAKTAWPGVAHFSAAPGTAACAPFQAAPGVWIAPDCSARATGSTLQASPFVGWRPATSMLQGALPAEVDLRRQGLDGPIKNQEMVGICWSFAVSTVMENAIRRAGRPDVIAPLHVLASNTWDHIWRNGRSDRALTLEQLWPYTPPKGCKLNEAKTEVWCEKAYNVKPGSWRSDPWLVAELERANAAGLYRLSRVEKLSVKPASTDQIARVLASGQAVFANLGYNQLVWADSGASGATIPDYVPTDGGHAVAIVGYRNGAIGRQFLLHNSWGTKWRDGGYAWISDSMVRLHLLDAFTVEVTPASAGAPTMHPDPMKPTPVATECAAGQARDRLLGVCAPACANGASPFGLVCPGIAGPTAPSASPSPLPWPAAAASCASGQVRDVLTGACNAACRSGVAAVGGICVF